jgi:predicted metal-dependent peptidase
MSSTVERTNSSLRFIKNSFRSTMGEDRFKALILLYVYKDIEIDISKVVEMYARQYPRRVLLFNPFSE